MSDIIPRKLEHLFHHGIWWCRDLAHLHLAFSTASIGNLLKAKDKEAAMRQSIEHSWLHKLGGRGASMRSLWIMTVLASVAVLYRVATYHLFDFWALLDTLVVGCLVFVLANVVRIALLFFQPKQAKGETSQAFAQEKS